MRYSKHHKTIINYKNSDFKKTEQKHQWLYFVVREIPQAYSEQAIKQANKQKKKKNKQAKKK